MLQPNLGLGIGFHAAGALAASNCYAPQKYARGWSWETFWLTQAAWCWLLWPIIIALITIPHLRQVLADSPRDTMVYAFLMGIAYGVGGTAFNISIRYIGFSLTYSIAVGLSSILGTLVPPLVRGEIATIVSRPGAPWVLGGVAAGAAGIAVCGFAGRMKERDLDAGAGQRGEFCLWKGLALSVVAGILSAVYGLGLEVAAPLADLAERYGAGIWRGNVCYIVVNTGAFVTAAAYSLWLARRHRSLGELAGLRQGSATRLPQGQLLWNYLFALFTGTLWYGQFFFYNLGHVRLGTRYAFSSWAIHMIMLVMFSNLLGLVFREWRDARLPTRIIVGMGIAVLCIAVMMLTYGNRLGGVS